jgi:UDP-N-acetylglucosamine--N-acetylmuramyl-(pentapeptide) pyrophosphoryl-undecaprenol N-acetylglucosamine transferase
VADKRGEFERRMEQAELGDPLSRLLGVIKATAGR